MSRRSVAAFTLIELLVVIAIIAVLAALAFTGVSGMTAKSDTAKCLSNLRSLAAAATSAKADNDGKFPAFKVHHWDANAFLSSDATFEWNNQPAPPSIGEVLGPYLGFNATSTMWIDPAKMPQPLRCPAAQKNKTDKSWINGCAAYRFNAYAIGRSVGPSSAMLFMDACWPDWAKETFSHRNPPAVNIAYADGHIATMPYAEFLEINPDSNGEYQGEFFKRGWLPQP